MARIQLTNPNDLVASPSISSPFQGNRFLRLASRKSFPTRTTRRGRFVSCSFSPMETAKIKAVGAGGGGNNAVNRMIGSGIQGGDFYSINTDSQELLQSAADTPIQIGELLTWGLGNGENPQLGEQAAEESRESIANALKGSDLEFITEGMCGGTGSGAASVAAQISKDAGCLTVDVVTYPLKRFLRALEPSQCASRNPRVVKNCARTHVSSVRLSLLSVRRPVLGVTCLASRGNDSSELFQGTVGSIFCYGSTHQMEKEEKLESPPFKPVPESYLWIAAPLVLILALTLPHSLVRSLVNARIKNLLLAELAASLMSDASFYAGLAAFLMITERVQRPYLQFSAKKWSLITGLSGYALLSTLTKVVISVFPLWAAYITWPELNLEALVAVVPLIAGFFVQFQFGRFLKSRGFFCWPLVRILFEVYRVYQMTKAAHFIEILLYTTTNLPSTPQVLQRINSLVAMLMMFQVLGLVFLWSFITFLLRLFPSRPIADS